MSTHTYDPTRMNVFSGPNSLIDYFNPDKNAPLPLVELPPQLNPYYDDGVRVYAKMLTALPATNVKSLPGKFAGSRFPLHTLLQSWVVPVNERETPQPRRRGCLPTVARGREKLNGDRREGKERRCETGIYMLRQRQIFSKTLDKIAVHCRGAWQPICYLILRKERDKIRLHPAGEAEASDRSTGLCILRACIATKTQDQTKGRGAGYKGC